VRIGPSGRVGLVGEGLHGLAFIGAALAAHATGLTGWRKHFAGDQQWGTLPKTASLQVFDDLDSLRKHVPHELYTLVEATTEQPAVEDLNI
jgi:EXLDI family protein